MRRLLITAILAVSLGVASVASAAPAVNLFFHHGLDEFGQLPGWQLGGDGSNSITGVGDGRVTLFTQQETFSQVFLGQEFDALPFMLRLSIDFTVDHPDLGDSLTVGWDGIALRFFNDATSSFLLPKGLTHLSFILEGRDAGDVADTLTSVATIALERVPAPMSLLLLLAGMVGVSVNRLMRA